MITARAHVLNPLGANFLLGQNKGLIRPGETNPSQILELCDAERRFGPKIEPLNECALSLSFYLKLIFRKIYQHHK